MVGAGKFFFRYRAYMFPVIFITLLVFCRPQVVIDEKTSNILIWFGFAVTMLGEGIRLFTIGFDYIIRGGKGGAVYADKLVTGGLYNHVRNPMYLGNLLIAVGIGFYCSSPVVMATVLPFFFFFYYALMANEENFLRGKFGQEFEDFCNRVNRLWPNLSGISNSLAGFSFNWRRSIIKDSGTGFYTFTALALLPLWRDYFLGNKEAFDAYTPYAAAIMAVLIPTYITLRILKRKGTFSPE